VPGKKTVTFKVKSSNKRIGGGENDAARVSSGYHGYGKDKRGENGVIGKKRGRRGKEKGLRESGKQQTVTSQRD